MAVVVGMVDTGIIHLPRTICTRGTTTVALDLTILMPMEGMVVGMDILHLCQVSFFVCVCVCVLFLVSWVCSVIVVVVVGFF